MTTVTVSSRGQLVIPKELRKHYGIHEKSKVTWIDTGHGMFLVPIPDDPIKALRGILKGKGPTTVDLLKERKEDRLREERKIARLFRSH